MKFLKKYLSFLLISSLLLTTGILSTEIPAKALEANSVFEAFFTDDQGVEYSYFNQSKVFVSGYTKDVKSDITIPPSIMVNGHSYVVSCIYAKAFLKCEKLKSITISGASEVSGGCFAGCINLEQIKFSGSDYCVDDKLNIYSRDRTVLVHASPVIDRVDIVDTVTYIGEMACSYNSLYTDITIPVSVINIGRYAFQGCENMRNITLSNVEYIEEGAFSQSGLVECELPGKCTSIENELFSGCSELTEVRMSDGVESFGINAFRNCTKLAKLAVPANLQLIGTDALNGCVSLKDFSISEKNQSYVYDGKGSIYNKEMSSLFFVLPWVESIELPEGVKRIETSACENSPKLVSVKLSKSLTEISSATFKNCISLRKVYIPDSVTDIGADAFSGCRSLEKVRISSALVLLDDGIFENCTELEGVKIPDGLQQIGNNVFSGCNSLHKIIIPASVEEIAGNQDDEEDSVLVWGEDNNIFTGTSKELVIYGEEGSLAEKYASAFGLIFSTDIMNAGVIEADEKEEELPPVDDNSNGNSSEGSTGNSDDNPEKEKTPAAIGTVLSDTKNGCTYKVLSDSVSAPGVSYVKRTGKEANVIIPDIVELDGIRYSVTAIADNAFSGDKKLSKITIGKNIQTIGKNVFRNCKKLNKIIIKGTALKKVGATAFKGVVKKAVVQVPKSKKAVYLKMLKKSGYKGKVK